MRSPLMRVLLSLALLCSWQAPVLALDGSVEHLRETSKAFAAVAREVAPSVVFIQVEKQTQSSAGATPFGGEQWPFGDDLFQHFFGDQYHGVPRSGQPRAEQHTIGQGSGFVFATGRDAGGDTTYIMTNNHVVDDTDSIRVKLLDGREFDATVKGRDPQSDVAVIAIRAGGVPALKLGDSSRLEVGEWVLAIGNPFGLSNTLTVGVVSATGRTSVGISDYEDFIQTDAAINPGNSGGPLVNLDGEVVGMNTAIFSRSGGYMGVGFAIPANLAGAIANQLIDTGAVTRGYLGVAIQQLTPDLAESFGIAPGKGVLVAEVTADAPAGRAGLRQGDVIVAYNAAPVNDVGSFRNRISLTPPGSRGELTVLRNGRQETLAVTIGTLTEQQAAATAEPAVQTAQRLGLSVQTLTPQLAGQVGAEPGEGVLVTEVQSGSLAARVGIEAGSVILRVNRADVHSVDEFSAALRESEAARRVLFLVRKGDMQRYVALRW
ncbi:MAG: DegQ family serine endoprotease [Pseudomonadota bacterium]